MFDYPVVLNRIISGRIIPILNSSYFVSRLSANFLNNSFEAGRLKISFARAIICSVVIASASGEVFSVQGIPRVALLFRHRLFPWCRL